jgi:hypothetical protein
LIGAKAQITVGSSDWPTFLGLPAQATAIVGVTGLLGLVATLLWWRLADHR